MKNKIIMHSITISFILFFSFIIYAANSGTELVVFKVLKYIPIGDKIGHLVLVGMLTFLANWSLRNKRIPVFGLRLLWGSFLVFSLISLEECSQQWITRRTFDVVDLLFNYLGIAMASFLNVKIMKPLRKST